MNDEELKKIIEETIGNNDPFWNEPVYNVVKKIIELPNESEITIAKLLNYDPKEAFVDPLTQGKISNLIEEVCKKINIGIEETGNEFIGLSYNVQYKKVKLNLERKFLEDKELKKIVEDTIGNNDPFWNEPVFNIVKKIIDLPEGTETTIMKLLGNTESSYNKFMFDIDKTVTKVCEKINIKLDRSKYKGAVVGLPFNIPFQKCYINNKSDTIEKTKLKTYITREIINLAEITIVANKYLKKNEIVENIMHDSPNYEYHFKFLDEEKSSVKDWVTNLKEKGAQEVYIDFTLPKNILTVAYTNATPAGIMCKYNDGKITSWHKVWNLDSETKKVIITYQEKVYEKSHFNLEFVNSFERNFNYFKETLKKIKELSEILGCKEWVDYFNNVFELEMIEKTKEFIPTKALYKVIPDKNLCVYAMAIQSYPFGGMGSWCDNVYEIAKERNMDNEYENLSRNLFLEIMGMISYATNNI